MTSTSSCASQSAEDLPAIAFPPLPQVAGADAMAKPHLSQAHSQRQTQGHNQGNQNHHHNRSRLIPPPRMFKQWARLPVALTSPDPESESQHQRVELNPFTKHMSRNSNGEEVPTQPGLAHQHQEDSEEGMMPMETEKPRGRRRTGKTREGFERREHNKEA